MKNPKALFVVVNAGFAEEIVDIARSLGAGGATIYAQYVGKNDHDEANRYFTTNLVCFMLLGIVIAVVGSLNIEAIVHMLGANSTVFPYTLSYVRITFLFIPVLLLYLLLSFFVRFDTDPNLVLISTIVCSLSNIVMTVVFVRYLNWGPAGASLGTCLAYALATLTLCVHFLKKRNRIRLNWAKRHLAKFWRSICAGLSVSVNMFSMAIVMMVFNIIIMRVGGETMVTIYALIVQVSMITSAIYEGIGQAAQPLFSTNFGAGNRERIQAAFSAGIRYELLLCAATSLLIMIFAEQLARCFNIRDAQTLLACGHAVRIYALSLPQTGLNVIAMYCLQGQEKVLESSLMSTSHTMVLLILSLLLLTKLFGASGIWWSWCVGETLSLLVSYWFIRRSKRQVGKPVQSI